MTLEEAVAYLKEQNLAAMEVGTYEVDGDFYFMIQEYETKEPDVCRLETHKNYIDIQWIISGEEAIDTVNVAGLIVEEAYDADRDVAFWKEPKEMCHGIIQWFLRYFAAKHRPQTGHARWRNGNDDKKMCSESTRTVITST